MTWQHLYDWAPMVIALALAAAVVIWLAIAAFGTLRWLMYDRSLERELKRREQANERSARRRLRSDD
jgi:hypothetical protein